MSQCTGHTLSNISIGDRRPVDLGLALLSEGLAKLHPSFEPQRVANGEQLAAAEAAAREKRLKVCCCRNPNPVHTAALQVCKRVRICCAPPVFEQEGD